MNFYFVFDFFYIYTNANASNQQCKLNKTGVENTIPERADYLAICF